MPGGWNLAGMTGVKEQYWAYRVESGRFRVFQGWTMLLIPFFSWWNKESGVLILYSQIANLLKTIAFSIRRMAEKQSIATVEIGATTET